MSLPLIPVLDDPDQCKVIADPPLRKECAGLNTMARNAVLQNLAPMYFAGMQRSAVQIVEGWSAQTRVYNAAYESPSIPPQFMLATIERFPKGYNAIERLNDITRVIPDYDPDQVTEEEIIPGQKVKHLASAQPPRAFWASENLLILVSFPTSSSFDRMLIGDWLRQHPSNLN